MTGGTPEAEILTVPGEMSVGRFLEVDRALKAWEKQVRDNAKAFPARSFQLGQAQIQAFMQLLGRTGITTLPPGTLPALGPTKQAAVEWAQRVSSSLDGAIDKYVDEMRSALTQGLRGGANPTQVASWLHKATRDAGVNWRTVARTEMVEANAAGRSTRSGAMGITQVWFPRHTGACADCRRLLEGQVFDITQLEGVSNRGRKREDWVACCPLHPGCRHVPLPWISDVYDAAQAEYQALEQSGLDDRALNEMFTESGQVKSGYETTRLAAFFGGVGKTVDPLRFALSRAVEKTRHQNPSGIVAKARKQEPPGLHHTSGRRRCSNCDFYKRPECTRYNWPVDADELCRSWARIDRDAPTIGKGYFDNPQQGLDPLLWTPEERLRDDVRDRIVRWWRKALGRDAPLWSHLFITGSAASRAWAGKTAGDLDLQVVIDYDQLRRCQPSAQVLPDAELHAAMVNAIKAALRGFEVANGLALDAYIRPQHTVPAFVASVRDRGQGVWDVQAGRWIVAPPEEPVAEDVDGGEILEGEGGDLALKHPAWLARARELRTHFENALAEPTRRRSRTCRPPTRSCTTSAPRSSRRATAPTGSGTSCGATSPTTAR